LATPKQGKLGKFLRCFYHTLQMSLYMVCREDASKSKARDVVLAYDPVTKAISHLFDEYLSIWFRVITRTSEIEANE